MELHRVKLEWKCLYLVEMLLLSTVIGLSHNMFDVALCLGICDKIVPGLLIGALKFGNLQFICVLVNNFYRY